MVGRRAVPSSSSDEAERPSRRLSRLTEEDVLQPVSKEIHTDNWPCFLLKGVVVYGKDGRTPANLLHAELEGPLLVRGRLEVDREFRHLRKIPVNKAQEIDVPGVKGFSMGIGPVTIWADGIAGWFEIRPHPSYQHIFDKMVEGVTLYYFLTDLYESKKNTTWEKSFQIEQIFEQYSKKFGNSMTHPQVAQRCEEHAVFLLSQMRKVNEPVRWARTTFYRWLVERCPHIYDRYRIKFNPNDRATTLNKQRGSTLSDIRAPNKTKGRYSSPALILKLMEELNQSGRLPRQRMNIRRLSRAIHSDYDIASESMAKVFLEVHVQPVFVGLSLDWANSPIYGELEKLLSQPHRANSMRKEAREMILQPRRVEDGSISQTSSANGRTSPAPGQRRKRPLRNEQDENPGFPEEEPESELANQSQKISGRIKSRQSLLDNTSQRNFRLRKTKPSTSPSEAGHTMTTRSRSSSDGGHNTTTPEHLPSHRRGPSRSGKVAALRLVGSSPRLTRISPPPSDDEIQGGRLRKRHKIFHSTNNDDSEVTQSSNDLTPYLEAGDSEDEDGLEAMEGLTLVSEALPSSSPQGPNGLWSCQREGCEYHVTAADRPDGRAKVQAHFLRHADEIAERERLVLEESRPYLPISHLLEKLRSLGEAARLAEERKINGRVVPHPIRRRLVA